MGCRVGITADIEARKESWELEYPSMTNWKILATGLSKVKAQEMEDMLAIAHNCDASPGGNDPDDIKATWSVYKFDF